MIEFPYVAENALPFPQVRLMIATANSGKFVSGLSAKVDTGADRTVIPGNLLVSLGVAPFDNLLFEGADGHRFQLPVYQLQVTIEGFGPIGVEAAGSGRESLILLGRDVLNLYRIALDGPHGRLELSGT